MVQNVGPVPCGFNSVTPHLILRGAAQAIEFYKKAFGAEEIYRCASPDGQSIWHSELRIGNSIIMLADEWPNMYNRAPETLGGTTVTLALYVADCDAVINQAVAAGAKVSMPPMDMFWGDRYGKVTDPFGHEWSVATHKEDVPPDELAKRAEAAMAEYACKE